MYAPPTSSSYAYLLRRRLDDLRSLARDDHDHDSGVAHHGPMWWWWSDETSHVHAIRALTQSIAVVVVPFSIAVSCCSLLACCIQQLQAVQ